MFQNLWDIENFFAQKGQRNFPSGFLANQYWKTSWVTHSALHNISVIETFYAWERKIKFFCRIFFVSQYRKNSWWPLQSFRLFGISETFCHIMIFRQIFWSQSTKKLRQEPSNVSEISKCEVSKKIVSKNGISRFSVENFLAQGAEGFRCGTLRYIRKVRYRKNSFLRGWYHFSPLIFFHVYCL